MSRTVAEVAVSHCELRLGKTLEDFSWPPAKRCVPTDGEAGAGDNYPEAEEGVAAEAEATDEEDAEAGTSVSETAEAAVAR